MEMFILMVAIYPQKGYLFSQAPSCCSQLLVATDQLNCSSSIEGNIPVYSKISVVSWVNEQLQLILVMGNPSLMRKVLQLFAQLHSHRFCDPQTGVPTPPSTLNILENFGGRV